MCERLDARLCCSGCEVLFEERAPELDVDEDAVEEEADEEDFVADSVADELDWLAVLSGEVIWKDSTRGAKPTLLFSRSKMV